MSGANSTSSSASHHPNIAPPRRQAQPRPPLEEPAGLSLIIGIVCVVGLILVVSIFVYVVCRLCRSPHGNRALLGKGEGGGRNGGGVGVVGNGGGGNAAMHKSKSVDVCGNGGDVGRLLTVGGTSPTGAYCLANSMTAGDVSSPSKPIDMYSPFGAHGKSQIKP